MTRTREDYFLAVWGYPTAVDDPDETREASAVISGVDLEDTACIHDVLHEFARRRRATFIGRCADGRRLFRRRRHGLTRSRPVFDLLDRLWGRSSGPRPMSGRIPARRKVVCTGWQDRRLPGSSTLRDGDESSGSERLRGGLEGVVGPTAIGAAVVDPFQDVELTLIKRVVECHAPMESPERFTGVRGARPTLERPAR